MYRSVPIIDTNPNTSWLQRREFFLFYFCLFVGLIIILQFLFGLGIGSAWTWASFIHTVVTFILLHWVKGSPLENPLHPQGKYDSYTFWEQIDAEIQYTPTKKFLMIIPLAILFVGLILPDSNPYLNVIFAGFCVVPKLAWFHKVRVFGINQ